MNDRNQMLDKIAPKLNRLAADPKARVSYELMSGSLVWSDELPPVEGLEPEEVWSLRPVWRYRSSVILGSPEEKHRSQWEQAQQLFPLWPGFRPERQSNQWQEFLRQSAEEAWRDWDELDRRYRESCQAKEVAPNSPTT
jgi:hypothetical protein